MCNLDGRSCPKDKWQQNFGVPGGSCGWSLSLTGYDSESKSTALMAQPYPLELARVGKPATLQQSWADCYNHCPFVYNFWVSSLHVTFFGDFLHYDSFYDFSWETLYLNAFRKIVNLTLSGHCLEAFLMACRPLSPDKHRARGDRYSRNLLEISAPELTQLVWDKQRQLTNSHWPGE